MKTITDAFEPYIGTHEYDGIVADIQRWFYGDLYKGAWCATAVSYFMNTLGLLEQLGGKNENVYEMMIATQRASTRTGIGKFMYRPEIPEGYLIKRGTIIFNLNSGTYMTVTSSKHVTTAYKDFEFHLRSGSFRGLGGNQSDEIRVSEYKQTKIYAIYEPQYANEPEERPVIKKGYKDSEHGGYWCAELQADLNELHITDQNNKALEVDGSCGGKTEAAIKKFQAAYGLEVDGHCGPITWAKITELLAKTGEKVKNTTSLYVRTGPGTNFAYKGVLPEGTLCTKVAEEGNWSFLEEPDGWCATKFLTKA